MIAERMTEGRSTLLWVTCNAPEFPFYSVLKNKKINHTCPFISYCNAACNRHLVLSHWKEFGGKITGLTLYLPKPMNCEGGRAGSKNLQQFPEKKAIEKLVSSQRSATISSECKWSAKKVTWNVCKPRGVLQAPGVTLQVTYTNGGYRWLHWLEINFA